MGFNLQILSNGIFFNFIYRSKENNLSTEYL